MIRLGQIGHVALCVSNLERSRSFYKQVLGFEVMEEDPAHGGTFMALGDSSHTVDMFAVPGLVAPDVQSLDLEKLREVSPPRLGMQHLAFKVESHEALRDAYFHLQDNGARIIMAVDHVTQESVYFFDPDANVLEIYWERPNAREMFRKGRSDQDAPLVFERPRSHAGPSA
jgi:catechol 2,3-dioxygenase